MTTTPRNLAIGIGAAGLVLQLGLAAGVAGFTHRGSSGKKDWTANPASTAYQAGYAAGVAGADIFSFEETKQRCFDASAATYGVNTQAGFDAFSGCLAGWTDGQ